MVEGIRTNTTQSATRKVKVKHTESTVVLAENLNRNGAEFINEGANSIWLELGAAAAEQQGLFLAKEGGTWNGMVGPMVWTGSVNGIAAVGETNLTVVEV